MIDFTGKRVVIFGGGAVGARKARYFAREAEVVVYSRSFHHEFEELAVKKEVCDLIPNKEALLPMIEDASFVIAATSDQELNELIQTICNQKRVLCNVAKGRPGDVMLPAQITGARYVIGISTKGSVPGISRLIREELEKSFPDLDDLIALGSWIRDTYREDQTAPGSYESVLYTALRDPETRKALAKGMVHAQEYVRRRFAT
jgi:precorrin-2 dehydrogenase/sirohydrochlorin ferrochelatase